MNRGLQPSGFVAAGGSGGGPYQASAVHLDGTTTFLSRSSPLVGVSNSPFLSFSGWFKGDFTVDGSGYIFNPDSTNFNSGWWIGGAQSNPAGNLEVFFGDGLGSAYSWGDNGDANSILAPVDTWFWLAFFADMNHDAGSKILRVFIATDGMSVQEMMPGHVTDASPAFSIDLTESVSFPDNLVADPVSYTAMDVADVWYAPGVLYDFSSPTNQAKFIDGAGKPVNPSGFPSSAVLFSGDASTFGENKETGGPFVTTGALTNATTHP